MPFILLPRFVTLRISLILIHPLSLSTGNKLSRQLFSAQQLNKLSTGNNWSSLSIGVAMPQVFHFDLLQNKQIGSEMSAVSTSSSVLPHTANFSNPRQQIDGHLFRAGSQHRLFTGHLYSLFRPCDPLTEVRQGHKWSLSGAYAPKIQRVSINKAYERVGECLVFPPQRKRIKPRAIVHLLGGAFIGAIPEVAYSLFIELLAKENFLIVATPYNVTFEHALAAEEVHCKFMNCLSILMDSGLSPASLTPDDISKLPVFCVGHSNGALLQLLIGSLFQDNLPKANAVIAFNNKPAADAIPYFEQFGPFMAQAPPITAVSPFLDLAKNLPGDPFRTLLDVASPFLEAYDEENLQSLQKFSEQIPLIFDQITRGISEFRPAPSENRATVASAYFVQETLLVKYTDDPIDESDIIEEILRPRVQAIKGGLDKLTLNGNHITPCAQDIKWQAGNFYTPADAVGQVMKSMALADIRETVKSLSNWFDSLI